MPRPEPVPLHTDESALPPQLTRFVGRERESAAIAELLMQDDVRLLTLTGPPGIGKTRLSLEVASNLSAHFPDGIYFVPLAPVTSPTLITSSVAQVLGLKQAGSRPLLESVQDYLRNRHLLLVLDNFEQIIEAAPLVVDVLSVAPLVKVLVTSREALRVSGEQEFAVPPLSLPSLDRLPTAAEIAQYEAVQLFTQRARSSNVDFTVTDQNAVVIAAICWRLDGLPLAIELAAARTKLLPPQALFERLGTRLNLLTGGARDMPPRHRTLRNAIGWSYDLLNSADRLLFRRLSVFVGGRSLEAIEAVCNADGSISDLLDSVSSLVDKSLLRPESAQGQELEGIGGEPRFVMLETIHEYAKEKLEESGEQEEIRRSHARYFLRLAEEAEPHLLDPDQNIWLDRLGKEYDNLRAALQWNQSTDGDAKFGLDMAAALGRFWSIRGNLHEGREWMSLVLSKVDGQERTSALGKALTWAGWLAYFQSDYGAARTFFEESLAIFREQGNKQGTAYALDGLGEIAHYEGDYKRAISLYEEWLSISRELEDIQGIAAALLFLGYTELRLVDIGDYALPVARLEEALALSRQIGIGYRVAEALRVLGEVSVRRGDYTEATALLQESITIARELDNKWGIAASQGTLAWIALLQADYAQATKLLMGSMLIRKEIGDKGGIAWCLEKLAGIAREQKQIERAICLLGAAHALRVNVGSGIDLADQPDHEQSIVAMRGQLGEVAFASGWTIGNNMTLDQALIFATEYTSEQHDSLAKEESARPSASPPCGDLTQRECEIAALIADSITNAGIAEMLVVSKRTVETHISNILSKLGFTSRGQIAAWAIKRGLPQNRS
ncbi:MAG: tetratricopeptide repeat protein [Chloroflexota bacterium]